VFNEGIKVPLLLPALSIPEFRDFSKVITKEGSLNNQESPETRASKYRVLGKSFDQKNVQLWGSVVLVIF